VAVELTAERRFPLPPWVASMADRDPDETVRRVARYYRNRVAPAGPEIRTVGGP
jgi:hypothetical protein